MSILVTGGAGYIGTHTLVELMNAGYDVVVLDNFAGSHPAALSRVERITGQPVVCRQADLLNREQVDRVFREHAIEAVIHFAGLKSVGESVRLPLSYYHNNVAGTLQLCEAMRRHGVKKLVFSSSAAVYGMADSDRIAEDAPLAPVTPYGRTKHMIELILRDLHQADGDWGIAILRYFNPVGAHESGWIGEVPGDAPASLLASIAQVAAGKRDRLYIYGNNYDTPDRTGVRDFIHVVDLAAGHVKALEKAASKPGVHVYNLGTGVRVRRPQAGGCGEKRGGSFPGQPGARLEGGPNVGRHVPGRMELGTKQPERVPANVKKTSNGWIDGCR